MKRNLRASVHIDFRHFVLYTAAEGVFWYFGFFCVLRI